MRYIMYNWQGKECKKTTFDATQATTAKLHQLNYCKENKLVPGKMGQIGSRAIREYEALLQDKSQLLIF